jgi:hypothetical protein
MRYKSLALTGIIVVLLVLGFLYVQGTPHYSLFQLKRAVNNHDADEALKYVNIDSIVDNLSRSFFGKGAGGISLEEGKGSSLKMLVADALPGIKESMRSSFRASVSSGSDEKQREKVAVQQHKNPAPSIGGIEIGGLDLRKLRESSVMDLVIQMDGETAFAYLKNNPGIKAKMVKTETGYWQIVEIILVP